MLIEKLTVPVPEIIQGVRRNNLVICTLEKL